MSYKITFAVSRFQDSTGTVSWRVSGLLFGVRIRRNFKTREEAASEKAALEIKAEHAASGLQTVVTCLTTEQVREAESALRRLAGQPRSLTAHLDYSQVPYPSPDPAPGGPRAGRSVGT